MKGFSGRYEREKEQEQCPPYYYNGMDSLRRGSSVSTVTVTRDDDMAEPGSLTPSDEDGSLSRPPSNYRYVV